MKLLLPTLAFAAVALLFWQCRPTKFTFDKLPETQIRWGHSGGFTGKATTFVLLENGQIFKNTSLDGNTSELPSAKSKVARGLFSTAENLELKKIQFDHPGNMTHFLEIWDKTGKTRIVWGSNDHQPEQKVLDFYTVLQQLIEVKR